MVFEIKKLNIVITGGTSGIGYELVKKLYETNQIIVIAHNTDKLEALKEKFPNIHIYNADLSKLQDIESVADILLKKYESIDLLINNAGIQHTPTFLDDDFYYQTISREITLNFTAVCSLCYLLLPSLLHKRPAAIVNINSGLALVPKKTSAIYCATKGAMNIFSQSLRYQLEDTNIQVMQAIMPLVNTPMTLGRGKGKISAEKAAERIIYGIEHGIQDHDIGKVKLLRILMRIAPGLAQRIMKRS